MPKPKKGETRENYIHRAMAQLKAEGLTQEQAVGKAEGMYDYYSKKKKPKR